VGAAGVARTLAGKGKGEVGAAGAKPPPTEKLIPQMRQAHPEEYTRHWQEAYNEILDSMGDAAQAVVKAQAAGRAESAGGQSVEKLRNAAFGHPDELVAAADRAAAWRVWMEKNKGDKELGAFGSAPKSGPPRKISREHMDYMQALAKDPQTTGKQAYETMRSFEGFNMDPARFHTLFSQFRAEALNKMPASKAAASEPFTRIPDDAKRRMYELGRDQSRPAKDIVNQLRREFPDVPWNDSTVANYISRDRIVTRRTSAPDKVLEKPIGFDDILQNKTVEDMLIKEFKTTHSVQDLAVKVNEMIGATPKQGVTAKQIREKLRELSAKGRLMGGAAAAAALDGDDAEADELPGPREPVSEHAKGGPFGPAMKLGGPKDEREHTQEITHQRHRDNIQGAVNAAYKDLKDTIEEHNKEATPNGNPERRRELWEKMMQIEDAISRMSRELREAPTPARKDIHDLMRRFFWGDKGQRAPERYGPGRQFRRKPEDNLQ
jgi:hypothetical protein